MKKDKNIRTRIIFFRTRFILNLSIFLNIWYDFPKQSKGDEMMDSLKQSFNLVASSYEKYRPSYPPQLFKDIVDYANISSCEPLLEIGTGTGKATVGFIERGYENITCIEYGGSLAALSKDKFSRFPNVQVVHSGFEDWHSDQKFSLAFSGTAFHFIPSEFGYPKVASSLKENGIAAFFWFIHVPSDDPVYRSIREVYQEHAPHLDDSNSLPLEDIIQERSELTLHSGHFHQLKVLTYNWDQNYTPKEYIGLLNTHSGHQVLPDPTKQALYKGVENAILQHGENITKRHVVALYLARKR
jgi:trans-aconitate methyltransferase